MMMILMMHWLSLRWSSAINSCISTKALVAGAFRLGLENNNEKLLGILSPALLLLYLYELSIK